MHLNLRTLRFKSILANLGLIFTIYTISRFLFLAFNQNTFNKFSAIEILNAILVGIRFDISALAYLNIIYVLFALLPLEFATSRLYQNFLKGVFLLFNFPILAFHICDIEYYKFTGARMTLALSAQTGEMINQFDQFLVHYWYIASICVLTLIVLWRFYQKFDVKPEIISKPTPTIATKTRSPQLNCVLYTLSSFVLITGLGIGARGGFLKKVLSPSYAFTVTHDELAILALNSSFTILKTHSKDHLNDIHFYPDLTSAKSHLLKPEFKYKGHPGQNVVILILESFATEFWGVANNGNGYTPFLDTLAKKGLFFRNNFANGRKSIEAVPSILLGLPSLMEHPLARSKFQFNEWHGLGSNLKAHGYNSIFFHGAETGSMHFDAVAKLSGLDKYSGLENYPRPEDTDGHWGIFDEPYLQFVNKELTKMSQPFLAVVFTLSSHQPYPIPEKYKNHFKKGPTPLHESIGYTDYALAEFFKAAEKEPWFKNTLFILTGDHTQMSPSVNYATELGRYMVPLLLYHPSFNLSANTQKITQHSDISATIYDFLGLQNEEGTLFSHSVWQNEGRAIFHSNGRYYLITPGKATIYDSNTAKFESLDFSHGDPNTALSTEPQPQDEPLQNELRAYIQYFNNGLNQNQIYEESKKF